MPNPGPQFGHEMKNLRIRAGMTTVVLARKLGTHKGYVSGIENAKVNPPSRKILVKMAKALGVDLEWLFKLSVVSKAPEEIRGEVGRKLLG
jgi:transcriptional regulator with XRE-family HTH domain